MIASLNTEIAPFFGTDELQQLAVQSGFEKRASGKINGEIFLKLIIANRESLKQQSLNGLCMRLFDTFGIEMQKQSLHERFNAYAVLFLKSALEQLLAKQLCSTEISKAIHGFSRILIKDSTCFDLSENLAVCYKGCGGSASKAAARIQFEFNVLSGTITAMSLTSYAVQDAVDAKATLEMVEAGDLIIRDLGYMHLEMLKGIIEKSACFASRLHPRCEVYAGADGARIDFKRLHKRMLVEKRNRLEIKVFIGTEEKIPLRLIVSLLPDGIVNERIRRLTEKQKRRGKGRTKLSEDYRARCRFNLFITNASSKQIPLGQVEILYKFRWLIELVFKMWKSTWKIHEVKEVKEHRLECYVYARLIALVTSWNVIWRLVQGTAAIASVAVSIDKCSKLFFSCIESVCELLWGSNEQARMFVTMIGRKINNLLSERHGKRPAQLEQIFLGMDGAAL